MTTRPLLALACLVPLLGACSDDPAPWPGDGDAVVSTVDLGAGFVGDLPEDWVVEQTFPAPTGPGDECGSLPAALDAGGIFVALRLPEAICADVPQPAPANDEHGDYVSLEDVSEPREVTTGEVPLGGLTTFVQTYTECTNDCVDSEDRVALVALADPVDPAHPTLLIRADADRVSESQITDLAAALRQA